MNYVIVWVGTDSKDVCVSLHFTGDFVSAVSLLVVQTGCED